MLKAKVGKEREVRRGLAQAQRNQSNSPIDWIAYETHEVKFILDCTPPGQKPNPHALGDAVDYSIIIFQFRFHLRRYL